MKLQPPTSIATQGALIPWRPGLVALMPGNEQAAAVSTYRTVSHLLKESGAVPRTVWCDIDDTLMRKIDGKEHLHGRVLGMLHAFRDRGSRIGIFSFRTEPSIQDFLKRHPIVCDVLTKTISGGIPIRGLCYVLQDALRNAMPEKGIFCKQLETGGRMVFQVSGYELVERIPKFIGPGEILIDDINFSLFYFAYESYARGVLHNWNESRIGRALEHSQRGFMFLEKSEEACTLDSTQIRRLRGVLKSIRNT